MFPGAQERQKLALRCDNAWNIVMIRGYGKALSEADRKTVADVLKDVANALDPSEAEAIG